MAYENLKAAIKQAIKQNGNQEITGNLLQSTLLSMADNIHEVVQSTGEAEDKVMSQKATSTELNKKANAEDVNNSMQELDKKLTDISKHAMFILNAGKIAITINREENKVSVVLPRDISIISGSVKYSTNESIEIQRDKEDASIFFLIFNTETKLFKIIRYQEQLKTNEVFMFGMNVNLKKVTCNPNLVTFDSLPATKASDVYYNNTHIEGKTINEALDDLYKKNEEAYSSLESQLTNISKHAVFILNAGKIAITINREENKVSVVLPRDISIISGSVKYSTNESIEIQRDKEDASIFFLIFNTETKLFKIIRYQEQLKTNEVFMFGMNVNLKKVTCNPNLVTFDSLPATKASDVYYNNTHIEGKTINEALDDLYKKNEEKSDVSTSSILYLNDNKTVGNLILQATRPYNSSTPGLSHKLLVLSVFTDIHGSKENLQRYMDFTNHYAQYIDDKLFLGDMVTDSWTDGIAFWNEVNGTDKILTVIGNHDTRLGTDWTHYAGKASYDRYFAPFIGNWNVIQPDGASNNGYCFYYKDYVEAKVRLIVLDCMSISGNTTQLSWFENVLSDAKNRGLSVISAKHYPFSVVQDKDNNTFNSLDFNPYWGNSKDTIKGFLDKIDSFISDGGDFICWLNGDSHYDFQGVIEEHPNQYAIAFENASLNSFWNDSVRIKDSKSQDSFNFVAFDTNTKLIKVVRVGNNSDRFLRHKNYICYDYKNKKIITCE